MKLPAVFMPGGTGKALVFHARDLPADRAEWVAIFLATMGSRTRTGASSMAWAAAMGWCTGALPSTAIWWSRAWPAAARRCRLDFLEPGDAATRRLLPSGSACDRFDVPAAADLGLAGTELPEALERNTTALGRARAIGANAVMALGLASDADARVASCQ